MTSTLSIKLDEHFSYIWISYKIEPLLVIYLHDLSLENFKLVKIFPLDFLEESRYIRVMTNSLSSFRELRKL